MKIEYKKLINLEEYQKNKNSIETHNSKRNSKRNSLISNSISNLMIVPN